jgi:predicted TIM-barrel fold metal-dependent hydrolase
MKQLYAEAIACLNRLRERYLTYDCHLHPFELFSRFEYREHADTPGLFSRRGTRYRPPLPGSFTEEGAQPSVCALLRGRPELINLMNQKVYEHTGPVVFKDHMDLAGIDRGLLLPVAREQDEFPLQMASLAGMMEGEGRFGIGTSVPPAVRDDQIQAYLHQQVLAHGAIAVKVHPNLSRIDLDIPAGRSRLEAIISASSATRLPVIIHGGSSLIPNAGECRFGQIENLCEVNLRADVPVVIAHGGAWGRSVESLRTEVLPVLKAMLLKHDNLFIDISGLSHEHLKCLFSAVELKRILFGSDGLYVAPARMVVRVVLALQELHTKVEATLLQIMSENPSKFIFNEKNVREKGLA